MINIGDKVFCIHNTYAFPGIVDYIEDGMITAWWELSEDVSHFFTFPEEDFEVVK